MTAIALPKWVKPSIIEAVFGYTKQALDKKRSRGIWLEGDIWRKAPDGVIKYSPDAIDKWVEHGCISKET